MNPTLDYTHDRLHAALIGIQDGKRRDDAVPVGTSFGKQTVIRNALIDAREYLKEPFHPDDIALIDSAFARLGKTRPSDRIDECATALLSALS